MDTFTRFARPWLGRLALALPALFLSFAPDALLAQEADPPGRVANLSWRDGGVVFAPAGEDEWVELPVNRPLTRGDRLWTDRNAKAELHLGSTTLQVGDESHLGITALDGDEAQLILMQGTLNARVRELDRGENVEVDTPNIAFRALEAGDYRIDVSPQGVTRVIVRSGRAAIYGEGGNAMELGAGQQLAFGGRDLARVADPFGGRDGFDQWVAERNRREDESVTAQHVPRAVVGYSQLDNHGSWSTVPEYGAVWYPRVTVADWAPYRYGRWEWVAPWGWTWIDDAPWGFAPFHYGRWTQIASRWAWVPGRLGPNPIYAPALVAFVGGTSGGTHWSLNVGSGPGIAWYPLAPGEAWRPSYRVSTLYLNNLNRHSTWRDRDHFHRRHAWALTAVPLDDFRRGRPVRSHWQRVRPESIAQAPLVQQLPQRLERGEWRGDRPRLVAQPPAGVPSWFNRRDILDDRRRAEIRAERERGREQREASRSVLPVPQGRDWQDRAEREARQQRHQQAVREMQERQRQDHGWRQQQDRAEREGRQQRHEQAVREMQERQRQEHGLRQQQQDRAEREARQQRQQQEWGQRMQERQQREQGEQRQRQQQEWAQRQQQQQVQQAEQRQRQQQEWAQRQQQQQVHQQREQAAQHQRQQQEWARHMQERQQQRQVQQAPRQQAQPQGQDGGRGRGHGRGNARGDDDDGGGRGRGQGHGRNG